MSGRRVEISEKIGERKWLEAVPPQAVKYRATRCAM
jgi:hypothetical protein